MAERFLDLTPPLPHQQSIDASDARWKVWRAGRRTGKTVWAGKAAVDGHGPIEGVSGMPRWSGLVQGRDVAWVVPAYPQSEIFWHEFVVPTFTGVGAVNATNRTVDLGTGGRLWIKSAEAVGTIRGLGSNLGGVLFEEAAGYPSMDAFRREIRPMLMDRKGWAAWISQTKAGSEFNDLCGKVLGEVPGYTRAEGWEQWHSTPYDNPVIEESEIEALKRLYEHNPDELREEVYADLLAGGAGLAFPMWSKKVHVCKDFQPPQHWQWAAGMDWGITAKSVVLLAAVDQERRCLVQREWYWRDKDAYTAGYDLATNWMHQAIHWPSILWCDSAMGAQTGLGGTTILQEFQGGFVDATKGMNTPSVAILPAPKGPGSIVAGYNQIRKMLHYGPPLKDENGSEWIPPSRMPRMRVVNDTVNGAPVGCPYLCSTIPVLKLDEKKQDQPESGGENHAVAALRYLLAGTWPRVTEPQADVPQDRHPGLLPSGQRRSRDRSPESLREEQKIVAQWKASQGGRPVGGRYGPSARRG